MAQIQMEVHEKMILTRNDILEAKPKKSGYNKFGNFHYYVLADFMPLVVMAAKKYHLSWTENFHSGENARAELTIVHTPSASSVTYTLPIDYSILKAGPGTPMQSIGSAITYARRYLWYNALALTDHDFLDTLDGDVEQIQQNPPPSQNNVSQSLSKIKSDNQQLKQRMADRGPNGR